MGQLSFSRGNPTKPMKKTFVAAGLLLGLASAQSSFAQVITDFESFATTAGSGSILFRNPSFSGSTSAKLDLTPNISQVVDTFPAGDSSTRALNVQFSFKAADAAPWLRLTTSTSTGAQLQNPIIDFTQNLSFDIYTDRDIKLALGVRETASTGNVGENGGTGGTGIEWVGATGGTSAAGPTATRTITAGVWTTVTFDIDGEPLAAFTGNAVLAGSKGTLEHLAFTPVGADRGSYNIYLDNFQVTPVPEPGALALGASGAVLLLALRRRHRSK
jgi:MYXO-CTERM domain-containing protein